MKAVKGTKDVIPPFGLFWYEMEKKIRELMRLYNYSEIRTPTFEETEVFSRGIGETTDIVGKEMYTFNDKGGKSLTLRPEETASVVRAYIEHNISMHSSLWKVFYIERMYRQENPQMGRLRQFTQFGAEVIGSFEPMVDVEIIDLALRSCEIFGLQNIELRLNSVGCSVCRPRYKNVLKDKFKREKICDNCKDKLERNPLRILDCKNEECRKIVNKAPSILNFLCGECLSHFNEVKRHLERLNIEYIQDNLLVRGLDYYTKTAFEIVSRRLGSQSALPGGGRYDGLVETMGGSRKGESKTTPGIGFACSFERMILAMEREGVSILRGNPVELFIAVLGSEAKNFCIGLIQKLRRAGISTDMEYLSRSLKAQMREAGRIKARKVMIVGDEEIRKGTCILRDMEKQEQKEIPLKNIIEEVKKEVLI